MKTFHLFLAVCALALSGCATITKDVTTNIAIVRDSFNSLLPPDFTGPVHLSVSDMYVNAVIDATGVHKLASGEWSWTSVKYNGQLTIPWFAGLTYTRVANFSIGDPNSVVIGNAIPAVSLGTTTTSTPVIVPPAGTTTTTVTTAVK